MLWRRAGSFPPDENACSGRQSRVVLASRVFPEFFQREFFAQICRAGLGLSSTVFSELFGNLRRSDQKSDASLIMPLVLDSTSISDEGRRRCPANRDTAGV